MCPHCLQLQEETGIAIEPGAFRFAVVENVIFGPKAHYVVVYMQAEAPKVRPCRLCGAGYVTGLKLAASCVALSYQRRSSMR